MKNIYLIEDHDEALKVWRQKGLKGLDLVHLDAHIDFGYYPAKPIEKIVNEAKNLKDLKKRLEHSIAFMQYEKDFDKQTNLGNYIYPAMEEGIVKNLYWVIPGRMEEFRESYESIKNILKGFITDRNQKIAIKGGLKKEMISTKLLGRNFIICTLERLPTLSQDVLLDIDTDFLVINNLLNAANTAKIGKRKPWILPQYLVSMLKNKIEKPQVITIAYSVNGGWTPIKHKHLADEMAYYFAPEMFKKCLERNYQAAKYFNLFLSSGKSEYYWKAANLNPTYRVADNNYGPLYLLLHKLSFAKDEFLKILKADLKNPACLLGLGNIALERKDYKKAKKYLSSSLNSTNSRLFNKVKKQSLLGLAKAEFNLNDFKKAKQLLFRYKTLEPLQPQSYYLLGRIFEKEKDFGRAAMFYKDAQRLGFNNTGAIWRLLQISRYLKEKTDIMKYIRLKYSGFKRAFTKEKNLSLKKGEKIKGFRGIEKKMASIEKMLQGKNVKK